MLWRGTFLLLIGQALALLSGYGIQVFLARTLEPEAYGTYGVVQSVLMIIELIVVAGIPAALRRFVGQSPEKGFALHKFLFKWQVSLAFILFAAAFVFAPQIADALNDHRLTPILRWAVVDIIFFAFYWYYNGFLTGQRRFAQQTLVVGIYTVSKFFLMVGVVSAGNHLVGAFVANFSASIVGWIAGVAVFKLEKSKGVASKREMAKFIAPSILYSVGLNLFFYIDLWFVKYYAFPAEVGYYNVASALGRMPYFFSTALSGAIIPSLAFAIGKNDENETRKIVRQAMRVLLLVLCPACVLVVGDAETIIGFLFGAEYLAAAPILEVLFVGMCMLTFFSVLNAINIAKSGMLTCGVIVLGVVVLDAGLNAWLTPKFYMQGAAWATTISMIFALIASAIYVYKQYRLFLPFKSVLRVSLITIVFYLSTIWFETDKIWTFVLKALGLLIFYLIALRVTGELSAEEVQKMKSFTLRSGKKS